MTGDTPTIAGRSMILTAAKSLPLALAMFLAIVVTRDAVEFAIGLTVAAAAALTYDALRARRRR